MTKLRTLAIACENDKNALINRSFIQDRRVGEYAEFCCSTLFESRALKDEDISLGNLSSVWSRGREEEKRILDGALSQDPDVGLFFVGSGARNNPNFSTLLKEVLKWRENRGRQSISIIVVRLTDLSIDELGWPEDTLFVDATWAELPASPTDQRMFSGTQDLLCAKLVQSAKRTQYEPEVGVGVLLINNAGEFLLAERLRFPSAGRYGTFGGSLPHLNSPEQAIEKQADKQFGIRSGLQIGPLLACTNLVSSTAVHAIKNHYIDLTFLALLDNDRASARDPLRHKPIHFDGSARVWFSLEEVYGFFRADQLFEPVANSFHRYCSWAALGHVTEASGVSSWMALHSGATQWVRALHRDKVDILTSVAAETTRNQCSPIYFNDGEVGAAKG